MLKYIKRIFINKDKKSLLNQLEVNKNKLSNLTNSKENAKLLLKIIILLIELLFKYKEEKYWLNICKNIDEYLSTPIIEAKKNLIDVLEQYKKDNIIDTDNYQLLISHIDINSKKYSKKAKIFNCEIASQYIPTNNKTIMIRLMDSNHLEEHKNNQNFSKFPKIKYKNIYYKIIEIYVDDIDKIQYPKEYFMKIKNDKTVITFDINMAKDLLGKIDNITNGDLNKYDLITHCRLGMSRSTAIFIALNEIYNLGYNDLKNIHNHYNRQIYAYMIEASELSTTRHKDVKQKTYTSVIKK